MGKGAFISIHNGTNEHLHVGPVNIVGIYQGGDHDSDFTNITGTLKAHSQLPDPNKEPSQYIEAYSSGGSFDMVFAWAGQPFILTFYADNDAWWVDKPLAKWGDTAPLEFATAVTPGPDGGNQYHLTISINYLENTESWMGDVYDLIKHYKLNMIPIPGSHDAITYPYIEPRSQTQSRSIFNQLMAGFRYFDFRVAVNNGVYYGYHGQIVDGHATGDPTQHNYTSVHPNAGHVPFVLDVIARFLKTHPKELVILNFSHFAGHDTQQFNPDDAKNFVQKVKDHFALKPQKQGDPVTMLVPSSYPRAIRTYGDCVDKGQQVVVIINDDDANRAQSWQDSLIWMASDCWLDRYSAISAPHIANVRYGIVPTLQDQEIYLAPPKPGETGHREPDKFWVTQAVLNYGILTEKEHSLNYWGAQIINTLATHVYEENWRNGHSHSWDGSQSFQVSPPNILLLDFAGEFDGFPTACIRMLRTKLP